VFSYPLTAQTDMPHKMKLDCQEICSNVMEKHSDNEAVREAEENAHNINISVLQCAKIIKEAMEEKYGGMGFWQVRGRDYVLVLFCVF
jgi:hypothetical protein